MQDIPLGTQRFTVRTAGAGEGDKSSIYRCGYFQQVLEIKKKKDESRSQLLFALTALFMACRKHYKERLSFGFFPSACYPQD